MIIDEEFAGLIPPLTDEEYRGLEVSILNEGCRDALVLWGDMLIDGHNRYRICSKHNIPYHVVQRDFADRNEVLLWMLKNQLGRRNLNDFQRIEMVRKCEDAVKAQAKERQGTSTDLQTSGQNFPEVKRATDTLGELAGVSRKTYEHAAAILDEAPEADVKADKAIVEAIYWEKLWRKGSNLTVRELTDKFLKWAEHPRRRDCNEEREQKLDGTGRTDIEPSA